MICIVDSISIGGGWLGPWLCLWSEVGSASHSTCAASVRATTLKLLRRKRFRDPPKIIAPQAQAQV